MPTDLAAKRGTNPLIMTVVLAAVGALVAAVVGFWVFEFGGSFIPVVVLAGLCLVLFQRGDTVLSYLGRLAVGSLLFGLLAVLFITTRNWLLVRLLSGEYFPFWPAYNPVESATWVMYLAFVYFIGALVGLVVKGTWMYTRRRPHH